jgi:hypothetical protein
MTMRNNTGVTDGYAPRAYPTDRKPREAVRVQHINTPEGRVFLIYVTMIGDALLGGTDAHLMTRQFKENGLIADELFREVNARLPEYASLYRQLTGKPLTKQICYNRWYMKSVYTNGPKGTHGKGRPGQSPEHYTKSKRLRPCVPDVEAAFRAGKPITLLDMAKLGAL